MSETFELPETDENSVAVLQLGATKDGQVEDTTGALNNADTVSSVETTDLTDATLRDRIERLVAGGASEIDLDVTRVELDEQLRESIVAKQLELQRRGISLRVIGLKSAANEGRNDRYG